MKKLTKAQKHAQLMKDLEKLFHERNLEVVEFQMWFMIMHAVASEKSQPWERLYFMKLYKWHLELYRILEKL